MERSAPEEIIARLLFTLQQGGQSLTEISREAKINRITTAKYLRALEKGNVLLSKQEGREQIFMLKNDPHTHFGLPISKEQRRTFNTYYHHITKFCEEKFHTKPTKTQAYKILWSLNQQLDLKLPIGWYKYGPCADQVFNKNECAEYDLNPAELKIVKETTEAFCDLTNQELQTKIYRESGNKFYIAKDELYNASEDEFDKNRDWLRFQLKELIRHSPQEINDIIHDFANVALLVNWNVMAPIFSEVWELAALAENKKTPHRICEGIACERLDVKILHQREIVEQHLKTIFQEHVQIKNAEDFRKAIDAWGTKSEPIKRMTQEERRALHKQFIADLDI